MIVILAPVLFSVIFSIIVDDKNRDKKGDDIRKSGRENFLQMIQTLGV